MIMQILNYLISCIFTRLLNQNEGLHGPFLYLTDAELQFQKFLKYSSVVRYEKETRICIILFTIISHPHEQIVTGQHYYFDGHTKALSFSLASFLVHIQLRCNHFVQLLLFLIKECIHLYMCSRKDERRRRRKKRKRMKKHSFIHVKKICCPSDYIKKLCSPTNVSTIKKCSKACCEPLQKLMLSKYKYTLNVKSKLIF